MNYVSGIMYETENWGIWGVAVMAQFGVDMMIIK